MKDLIGQEIVIGQMVAFNPPVYKGLGVGKVVGFTPKLVKIEFTRNWTGRPEVTTTPVAPKNIAVLDEKAALMYLLSKE